MTYIITQELKKVGNYLKRGFYGFCDYMD